uniref:Uncharacterized protein n=1 Tax=Gasterosteus aculeatus TaxID=69293 RepID=G3P685_GASAC
DVCRKRPLLLLLIFTGKSWDHGCRVKTDRCDSDWKDRHRLTPPPHSLPPQKQILFQVSAGKVRVCVGVCGCVWGGVCVC